MAGKREPAVRRRGQDGRRFDMAVTASVILCVMAAAAAAVGGHIYESRGEPEAMQVDMIIEETRAVSQTEVTADENISAAEENTDYESVRITDSGTSEAVEVTMPEIPETFTETDVQEIKAGGLVNINTASAEELESLDGIGEKLAGAIIEYRKVKPFDTIEEIMQVKGIGEKKFDKIRDSITC